MLCYLLKKMLTIVMIFVFIIMSISASHITSSGSFGKTHFIAGYPQALVNDQVQREQKSIPRSSLSTSSAISQVLGRPLFSPDDDLQAKILDLIAHEKHCIKIAAYMLNDEQIVQALLKASQRGVKVEIIADGTMIDRFSQIQTLRQFPEIAIYEYAPQKKSFSAALMHNKFIIFCCNVLDDLSGNGRPLVITGSCNFTGKAYKKNQENMVILLGNVVQDYSHQFDKIKIRALEIMAQKAQELTTPKDKEDE